MTKHKKTMFVDLDVSGCPNTCRHCARDGRPPYGEQFTISEIHAIRDEWGPLITHCYEPTAHPDFPHLCDHETTVEPGGYVITNGFGLARRPDHAVLYEQMHALGVHTLVFTLHGLQEHHDWFACRRGAFDDIVVATRRAKEADFRVMWQILVDRQGLGDIAAVVELAQEYGAELSHIGIPYHRVSKRLWQYEQWRPTLQDVCEWELSGLLGDPKKNSLMDPETLTATVWLEKWRETPDADAFKHPFEPPTWPPQRSFERLNVYIRKDRQVYFDPICAPPQLLGKLSDGKEALLQKLESTPSPPHFDVDPHLVELPLAERERLHPSGFSLRYKLISSAYFAERGA